MWLWLLLALPTAMAGGVKIERISPPPLDLEVTVPGEVPAISADGRFVAFAVEGQNIYLRDRQTGKTELVSVSSSGMSATSSVPPIYSSSSSPAISADGRFVAFASYATNLVPGDTNGGVDVFVRDRQTGQTERVTDGGYSPTISADGRFVAFVAGAGNIYVRDRQSGRSELVSVAPSGAPANGGGYSPAISADGRFVAFVSYASNLVPGDTNSVEDIFVRDRQTGKTELVSVAANGAPANGHSSSPAISADGRFVAFASRAPNLVPGDTNGEWDAFVRDRQIGKTERMGDGASHPTISADGRFVVFDGIFVWDRQTGKTEQMAEGSFPAISADGRFVAFVSWADNLVPGDTKGTVDLFVRDRATATSEVITVSVNVGRTPLESGQPAMSADGQWVGFVTAGQVFQRNRITGAATLVSATPSGAPANGYSSSPAISGDGRFVAFVSYADDLVPGDTNGKTDLFVRDRQTGKTELVSVAANGAPANGHSSSPAISADGRFVAFQSDATNLVPGNTNDAPDLFVRDRQTGKTELVSVGANGTPTNGDSYSLSISADGRFVAFESDATNLVSGDTNDVSDIFVRDRQTGKTELISVAADGGAANGGIGFYASTSISADGRFVAFGSDADNLVPGATNRQEDLFVRDRQTDKTELVIFEGSRRSGRIGSLSISADGRYVAFAYGVAPEGNRYWDLLVRDRQTGKTESVADSLSPAISADGRFVAFQSLDNDLVPGDTNGKLDVFVAERE